jgi:hypothetical protein
MADCCLPAPRKIACNVQGPARRSDMPCDGTLALTRLQSSIPVLGISQKQFCISQIGGGVKPCIRCANPADKNKTENYQKEKSHPRLSPHALPPHSVLQRVPPFGTSFTELRDIYLQWLAPTCLCVY